MGCVGQFSKYENIVYNKILQNITQTWNERKKEISLIFNEETLYSVKQFNEMNKMKE